MTAAAEPAAPRRGRPRSTAVRDRLLAATHELLDQRGFRATTMEAIAERAGASKVTLYRWWPTKAAIVMDAFFAEYAPKLPFQHTDDALADIRAQMHSFGRLFSGRAGVLLRMLAAEGMIDESIAAEFRERWMAPRRLEARLIIDQAIAQGQLAPGCEYDVLIDALFGPIYFRLLMQHRPLTRAFIDRLADLVIRGLRPAT